MSLRKIGVSFRNAPALTYMHNRLMQTILQSFVFNDMSSATLTYERPHKHMSRVICNQGVSGSNPDGGTNKINDLCGIECNSLHTEW